MLSFFLRKTTVMAKRIKITKKSSFQEPLSRERKKFVTKQDRIEGLTPHVGEIVIYTFLILLLSAGTYWRNGIWNSDTELWMDCVKKSPNKERPHINLGQALLDQDKYQEAIAQFTEALRINPNSLEPHNNLGNLFVRQGKYQEAVDHFTEALRMDPNDPVAHHNLGNALVGQGRYQEAIAQFTEALRISPHYAPTHYNLGSAYLRIGDRDAAFEEYKILKTMNPDMASALYKKIR